MACLSAKEDRLCTSCIEFCDEQICRGHLVGSWITPRSFSTTTVWSQTLHLKNAIFMSGMMGVDRITSPFTVTSLSISTGLSSRIPFWFWMLNGRTLYTFDSISSTSWSCGSVLDELSRTRDTIQSLMVWSMIGMTSCG
ncbi:hypothetical protein OGATHE_003892 [Ogataea polymorpha]|uniref:Uncharacterized protein n=1 Tax=Ogataea polymorpha TaxID=460523 RepID=A0A9P8P4G2_9ASCO|nr:hypothetical protein OGATHE_003892 [Ogataea polymorpha]